MQSISVVIITLNEQRNIERCLKSLQGITDDVIVVDSFSSDETPEICKKYNVNFVQTKWKGYSETKNYANSLAKNDWILSLDADEALSAELKQSITDALLQTKMKPYRINRLTNYCGKWIRHGTWYPDYKLRVFNRKQMKWVGSIHETLSGVDEKYAEILEGDCLHYSYYTIEEHRLRSVKYAKLSADKIAAKKKKVGLKKIFSPLARFIQMYFIKLGFLDGYYGFVIARITAKEVRLKYKWASELLRK